MKFSKLNLGKRELVMGTVGLSTAILMTFLCLMLKLQSKRPGLLLFVVAIPSITSTIASDRALTWLGLTIPANPADPMEADRYFEMINQAIDQRMADLYDEAIQSGNVEAAGFLQSKKKTQIRG